MLETSVREHGGGDKGDIRAIVRSSTSVSACAEQSDQTMDTTDKASIARAVAQISQTVRSLPGWRDVVHRSQEQVALDAPGSLARSPTGRLSTCSSAMRASILASCR